MLYQERFARFDSIAIKGDPHLPSFDPADSTESFEITEAAVIDMTGPPLSTPKSLHLTSDVVKGSVRLSINSVGELWAPLGPGRICRIRVV